MSDIRAEWITTIQKYRLSPDRPDNERFWCTQLDTAPQEELRAIQGEKLRVAVRYVYECIPFYRRKFDRIGLKPGDIRSVVDLPLIPVYRPHVGSIISDHCVKPHYEGNRRHSHETQH